MIPFFELKKPKGFTLIEIIVVMWLISLFSAVIYNLYTITVEGDRMDKDQLWMTQNIRAVMFIVSNEIRMAGFNGERPFLQQYAGIIKAEPDKLKFSFVADDDNFDNDHDNTIDEVGEVSTIEYSLYDAYQDRDNDFGRTVNGMVNRKRAIAENIDRVEFLYTLSDGSQLLNPVGDQLDQIRAIKITILAKGRHESKRVNQQQNRFRTAANTPWVFNDKYPRKMVSTTIFCRNMRTR